MKTTATRLTTIGKAFHSLMEFSGDFACLSYTKAKNLVNEFPLSSNDQDLVLKSIEKISFDMAKNYANDLNYSFTTHNIFFYVSHEILDAMNN